MRGHRVAIVQGSTERVEWTSEWRSTPSSSKKKSQVIMSVANEGEKYVRNKKHPKERKKRSVRRILIPAYPLLPLEFPSRGGQQTRTSSEVPSREFEDLEPSASIFQHAYRPPTRAHVHIHKSELLKRAKQVRRAQLYSVLAMRSVTRRSGRPGMSAATRLWPNTAMGGTSCAAGRHADEVGQRESASWAAVLKRFETRVRTGSHDVRPRRMKAGLEDSSAPTAGRAVSGSRNAGELSGGANGCVWKEIRALVHGMMCVGTLGKISDMRGKEGEMGKLVQAMSGSEMLLAGRPRQLGGRIFKFGDGGDGEGLGGPGYVGNGT
ncbi:hypothetical protein EDB86DRAFT_2830714 [Lactarius hatsudake]|nr:hypothetical protein EDB86DRAFT_2830714 [Lactarius hatsudake]